ncbi:MAG: hypothetical protein Q4A78_05110 [Peptostreptococcaceae bacterium]|nr:hypothetical protein [Peptostreptococcaceae bacterium]
MAKSLAFMYMTLTPPILVGILTRVWCRLLILAFAQKTDGRRKAMERREEDLRRQ